MTAPSGVVTFLFTDIEGSTRRWEADADGMRTALAEHDQGLRETIAAHNGWLFKHTGDGMCAAFESPSAAVDAAVEAQRTLELPVRMGIATGEAELREDDYFGPVLNRAARVMACGHGGQILIDGATALLINGFELIELGRRRLRDLAQPVDILQVRSPGLRTEFPPLKTLDPAPGNLRPQNTSFVGRESELAGGEGALRTHRLVTLTGVGGVGKTRLALEVAARVSNNFPDGVWVIELAPVTDPVAVPEAAAAALGITPQPGMTLSESISAALEGRSRLLIFDNCEHVLDAAADLIDAILARSTTVQILATSREGLRVTDEQLWPVPSLTVNTAIDSNAATLFVDRARGVAPGISLAGSDEAAAVLEICRRLDGIPLAIELAASRMQSMTVIEVRDRLDDRFRLLVGSRRGLERHQTLRHAVQWSYDLLDTAEKDLLARCAVFAGGFDLAGAVAVAGSDDDFSTLDALDALVRKSLLTADRSSARTRFAMLETIRQFAEEQLVATGGADDARNAHGRYFAGRETDLLALWDGPRQREAYTWFTVELANLRTAFRWVADHQNLDSAAAIAFYATFLGGWVEQFEPSAWAEELIEPAKAADHRRLAQLYVMAAYCYLTAGRIHDAIGYLEASQALIEGGRFTIDGFPTDSDAMIGGIYLSDGQPKRWVQLCRNVIARSTGDHTFARACLVIALTRAGVLSEAITESEGLLAAADATDNPTVVAWALLAYAGAYRHIDPEAAHGALRRGLVVAQDCGNRQMESSLAVSLSRVGAIHGDPAEAFDSLTLAIRHYRDSGNFALLPNALSVLATLFNRLGYHEPASAIIGFADNPLTKTGLPEIATMIDDLRDVLGGEAYEASARAGATMTAAAMVPYAFEQIDRARAELPR